MGTKHTNVLIPSPVVKPSALIPDVNSLDDSQARSHGGGVGKDEHLPTLFSGVRRELTVEPRHLIRVDKDFMAFLPWGGGHGGVGWEEKEEKLRRARECVCVLNCT